MGVSAPQGGEYETSIMEYLLELNEEEALDEEAEREEYDEDGYMWY